MKTCGIIYRNNLYTNKTVSFTPTLANTIFGFGEPLELYLRLPCLQRCFCSKVSAKRKTQKPNKLSKAVSAKPRLHFKRAHTGRVARWFVFKPKIPIWINFGGPYIGNYFYCFYIFGNLEYFMEIWDIL
jgi:hypothetical protein